MTRNTIAAAVTLGLVACASRASQSTSPLSAPAATAEPLIAVVIPAATTAPAVPAPLLSAEPAVAATPESDPCTGAAFDLDHVPSACGTKRGAPSVTTSAFVAVLIPEAKTVRSGEDLGVDLTLTNITDKDQVVVLHHGCEYFELQAYARGKRADYFTDCGHGRGCGSATYRVVVTPNGRLTRKLKFEAQLRREMSQTNCSTTVLPLAPGRYELRVAVDDFVLADAVKKVRAPIEVVR